MYFVIIFLILAQLWIPINQVDNLRHMCVCVLVKGWTFRKPKRVWLWCPGVMMATGAVLAYGYKFDFYVTLIYSCDRGVATLPADTQQLLQLLSWMINFLSRKGFVPSSSFWEFLETNIETKIIVKTINHFYS